MLPEPTALTPTEIVAGRPFTDPEQIGLDFTILEAMRRSLRQTLAALPTELPPGRSSTSPRRTGARTASSC